MKTRVQLILQAGLSAFLVYFCMYAFRKPFAAATFAEQDVFGVDFKILLVISQVAGYALSKFMGISFVSGHGLHRRGVFIVLFVAMAELALLGFALAPTSWKFFFLFLNGIPLGMIWGLVFSYLEGRTVTELLAAMLSASYIIASGITKSVGKYLMNTFDISTYWMPFYTGALFLVPLIIGVIWLERIPAPTPVDIRNRQKREPMTRADRRQMFSSLAPGLVALIIILFLMTAFRDLRDNFAAELWEHLGYGHSAAVFAQTELFITAGVLVTLSGVMLIQDNLKALLIMYVLMAIGMILLLLSTYAYQGWKLISPFSWMTLSGLGVFLAYVPLGCMVFERISAIYNFRSNAGYLIYVADAISYLGSVMVLVVKEVLYPDLSIYDYFSQLLYVVGIISLLCITVAYIYFERREQRGTLAEPG